MGLLLTLSFLSHLVIHYTIITSTSATTAYVHPSESTSCGSSRPCHTLNDYASNNSELDIVDNTTLVFLRGTHYLDAPLSLMNLSSIQFIGGDKPQQELDAVRVVLSPLVNITWTDCDSVEIRALTFVFNGHSEEDFSRIVFERTNAILSSTTFLGNNFTSRALLLSDSSYLNVSNVHVSGALSSRGSALYGISSTVDFHGQNDFVNNVASYEGGAIALYNSTSNVVGSILFLNNTATCGGALFTSGGSQTVSGNITFSCNTANSGGAMSTIGGRHNAPGNMHFINNEAKNGSGGAVLTSGGSHNISGYTSLVNNRALLQDVDFRGGGALSASNSNYCIAGHALFVNNSAPYGNGGAMSLSDISMNMSGDIRFFGNTAMYDGGAMVLFRGTTILSGHVSFVNNSVSSRNGGALSINSGQLNISGTSLFAHNSARYEAGALEFYRSAGFISGHSSFINNSVSYTYGSGGAVEMDTINGESLILTGTQNFEENFAERGGAFAFFGRYKLILANPLQLSFNNNTAKSEGGAMYFADDTTARVQCTTPYFSRDDCHIELTSLSNVHLNFSHNVAGRAGTLIYGGGLDSCKLYTGGGNTDMFGEVEGGSYSYDPTETIRNISNIVSADNITSDISSNRRKVCVCEDDRSECEILHRAVVRGQKFTLYASILEQSNTVVVSDSTVRISLENNVQINPAQRLQKIKDECAPISYRLLSSRNQTFIMLSPDNSACQDGLQVNITFLPCPDAFILRGSECICESRLQRYNTTCNVDDGSISRATSTFWMKPLYENKTYKGLVLHSGCPFDYCIDTQVNITFSDLDAQCNYNHSGTLCGSCKDNFSIALGTLHCLPCTNNYLALILPFALAGIVLVAVLLFLQVSVASGTINGLVFFANIIQANRLDFFPSGETNILTIFVAWLNLDLGIEVCLYDGMTTYVYAWLQFLFPFYVWFLIGLIILASHYSNKIAGHLGTNPVAVLATLILLSYSKILNNIIVSLSVTRLEYPTNSKYVWLYDGNVPYFQRLDHIVLAAFAILVFVLLFLPYTLLLLISPWLQTYSNRRILYWINKTKPFLDAYYGPYKKGTRYWTALLLIIRCILLLAFALNTLSNSNFDLLLVTSLTAGLAGIAWIHNGVYEKTRNDIIEASFMINLCVLAAATYHVNKSGGNQGALVYTSVGLAFATFVSILFYHILLVLRKSSIWKKANEKYKISAIKVDADSSRGDSKQPAERNQLPSVTTCEFELREPLLD